MKRIIRVTALVLAVFLLTGCSKNKSASKEGNIMGVVHVTNESFNQVVMQSSKTVLLDFWAPWCGPCQMVGPILEEIAMDRDDVLVCKINVDEEWELAQQFGVTSIPLLVVMEDGKIVDQAVGARPKAAIEAMLP